MAYRLDLGASVPQELRRCASDQLRSAIAKLDDAEADRVAAVHDARKSIKKTRAVLRLARSGVPADAYRAQNAALRDAGRALAGVRDADVLVLTVDALAERWAGRIPVSAFDAARRAAATGSDGDGAAPSGDAAQAVECGRADLAAIEGAVASWPLAGCDLGDLVDGLARAYERGRRRRRAAERRPTVEALHEWRKRVKDLWYQERLLRDLWPDLLEAQIAETRLLGELLGEDHDLAVLRAALDASPTAPAVVDVGELVDERRRELQATATASARRVYAESPGAFARRMGRLAKAARAAA